MSNIATVVEKLDSYIMDEKLSADTIGTRIIEDVVRDEEYEELSDRYSELADIADRASDMEFESKEYAEAGLVEIRKMFVNLKAQI